MSMAVDHQWKGFTNSVKFLRDIIEPLYNIHYNPVEIANFLDSETGVDSLQHDLETRHSASGSTLNQGPVQDYISQYEAAHGRDWNPVRRIGRRIGHRLSSYGPWKLGGALALAGGLIGAAYSVIANYEMPDPSFCFANFECGPNPVLGVLKKTGYVLMGALMPALISGAPGYVAGWLSRRAYYRGD